MSPLEAYLGQLRAGLPGPGRDLILAEAEDHLHADGCERAVRHTPAGQMRRSAPGPVVTPGTGERGVYLMFWGVPPLVMKILVWSRP
jgi:hypothetical protein